MSAQTSTTVRGERAERYEELLEIRAQLGREVVDGICHDDRSETIALFRRIEQLDQRLSRFRRYSADYQKVALAEDARWHVPPGGPEDDVARPCSRCLRGVLRLGSDIVLLPATRRSS